VNSFKYLACASLDEATLCLSSDPNAKLLAGGMTLLPAMKHRLIAPSQLIDLMPLDAMRDIDLTGDCLTLGALLTHQQVADSPTVQQAIAALAQLASSIGDPQVRQRGTLGGSVANNDPAADYPAALMALDAQLQTTKRRLMAEDFFLGMFSTALVEGEIITAVSFSVPKRSAYAKFRHPASGYAMAGVFVAEFDTDIRVAVTGVADGVFRWHEAEQALAQGRCDVTLAHPGLLDDLHAPAAYRAHLAGLMLEQAFHQLSIT
jgi:carbon-monoxide dehydrogenase medium subunit